RKKQPFQPLPPKSSFKPTDNPAINRWLAAGEGSGDPTDNFEDLADFVEDDDPAPKAGRGSTSWRLARLPHSWEEKTKKWREESKIGEERLRQCEQELSRRKAEEGAEGVDVDGEDDSVVMDKPLAADMWPLA